jgi:hypothetical protein
MWKWNPRKAEFTLFPWLFQRWFHVSKGILFIIIIYINNKRANDEHITHTKKNHLQNLLKILEIFYMGLNATSLRNFFITSHKRYKIFNRWNDNIILFQIPNHLQFVRCVYVVAASWSCKMSFDEGMARDTFLLQKFWCDRGLSMDWTKTQQKKYNIFFICIFNQNITRRINSHIIT